MKKPYAAMSQAIISQCGAFRYWLCRVWDTRTHRMIFVMLNPSTANATIDDPTIRKCIGFAQRGGYGSIVVMNLFAYRATSPAVLKRAGWPTGPDNAETLQRVLQEAKDRGDVVVCAWGANARGRPEASAFIRRARDMGVELFALRRSPDGTPHHPLMLPYSCKLEAM